MKKTLIISLAFILAVSFAVFAVEAEKKAAGTEVKPEIIVGEITAIDATGLTLTVKNEAAVETVIKASKGQLKKCKVGQTVEVKLVTAEDGSKKASAIKQIKVKKAKKAPEAKAEEKAGAEKKADEKAPKTDEKAPKADKPAKK